MTTSISPAAQVTVELYGYSESTKHVPSIQHIVRPLTSSPMTRVSLYSHTSTLIDNSVNFWSLCDYNFDSLLTYIVFIYSSLNWELTPTTTSLLQEL